MRALIRLFAATTALALSTGVAFAFMGKTRTDVALQTAPAAQRAVILNLPAHARVSVGQGGRGCCGATWDKSDGHVRGSVLQVQRRPAGGVSANSGPSALSL